MPKTKTRADGLVERCRVINGKKRHFYGKTLKEVQAKIDAAIVEAAVCKEKGEPFIDVADAFWTKKEPTIR